MPLISSNLKFLSGLSEKIYGNDVMFWNDKLLSKLLVGMGTDTLISLYNIFEIVENETLIESLTPIPSH